MNSAQMPPQAQIMQFILSKWISKPIYVAAELGIADILSDGPKRIDKIAHLSGTHSSTLYRIMRALACLGIFREIDDKTFELTPMAECLKTGALRPIARMMHSDWHDRAWDNLLYSVKSGKASFDNAFGMPVFQWFKENPEAENIFNQANAVKAATSHRAIVDSYDFSGIETLVDIGGGIGALMVEVLKSNPAMKGIIAERPTILKEAQKFIEQNELTERCTALECDFFKEIPVNSSAFLMSHILHDWEDEKAIKILKNCHSAMTSDEKIIVVESVVPDNNEFSIAKLLDLEVLVIGGGKERTESEFRLLFESSGFKLSRIVQTRESISIIEGIRLT